MTEFALRVPIGTGMAGFHRRATDAAVGPGGGRRYAASVRGDDGAGRMADLAFPASAWAIHAPCSIADL